MILTKIVLLEDKGCNIEPKYRDTDGTISIKVTEEITLNIVEKQLSNYNKVISDFTNSFTQSVSKTDQMKLNFAHNTKVRTGTKKYRGYLMSDGIKVLDGFIYVSQTNEQPINGNVKYTIQIIGTHQQWKEGSKLLKVCDIKTQENNFIWDDINVLSAWKDVTGAYVNDSYSFYPLLANFGEYFTNVGFNGSQQMAKVSLQDIRVLNYLYPIVKNGFCQLGYEVKSNFMETDYFRRQAGYHSDENFVDNCIVNKSQLFDVNALYDENNHSLYVHFDANPEPYQYIRFYDNLIPENFDNGNCWRNQDFITTYEHCFVNNTGGTVNYEFNYYVRLNKEFFNIQTFADIDLLLIYGDDNGSSVFVDVIESYSQLSNGTITFEGTINKNVKENNFVQLGFRSSGEPIRLLEAKLTNKRISNILLQGDEIQVEKTISPELTFNDIMFEISTMWGLSFDTKESTKQIRFEPDPTSYRAWEMTLDQFIQLDGFTGRKENSIDYTTNIDLCQEIQKDLQQRSRPSSYLFKFKDSTDKYELYKEYTDDAPLWSKQIDVLNGLEDQVKIDLKKYEPTLNNFDTSLQQTLSEAPYIPYMWERELNEDGTAPQVGFKLGYRIFCVLGWIEQYRYSYGNKARWIFENVLYDYIPTVSQLYPIHYAPFSVDDNPTPRLSNLNNVFGNVQNENGIIADFHQGTITNELEGVEMTFSVQLSNLKAKCSGVGETIFLGFTGGAELFNGFYKRTQINRLINGNNKGILKARYINPVSDCDTFTPVTIIDDCNAEDILRTALIWVDAMDILGDSTTLANGADVDRWADRSIHSNDLLKIGNETSPTKGTASGLPVVSFNPAQLMSQYDVNTLGRKVIFIVTKGSPVAGDVISVNTASNPWSVQITDGLGNIKVIAPNTTTYTEAVPSLGGYNIYNIVAVRWGPNDIAQNMFRFNGQVLGNTIGEAQGIPTSNLFVGRSATGGNNQSASIHEIAIFNKVLTTEETRCIEEYLSAKWNIPLL